MTNGVAALGDLVSDPDICLPELMSAVAARTPDAVAVVVGHRELSYRELDDRAGRLGRHLVDCGVGPDVVVGLHLERSIDMVVGLLAILKAGGAYLPLDTGLPAERMAMILDSARPRLVLTREALADRLAGCRAATVYVDHDRADVAAGGRETRSGGACPGNLAYVIYTSGSTGVPKGIMIDHRALRDRILAKAAAYEFGGDDRVLQFTSLSFDAAADEIYPTLVSGAALVVHPNPSWTSPPELLAGCAHLGVTGVMLPPVYLQLLVDAMTEAGLSAPWLRVFITGGESIPVERLAAWARLVPHRPRFFYAYGPTETTIAATLYEAPMDPVEIERLARVPIGRAMPNTGIHVLDDRLRPVAPGQVGELWITGSGLARGYLGDPALTAERFAPSPFCAEPGARMYRTGDLARETGTGELEFHGRVDDQVKIRGHRVDLGDVEAALTGHPDLGSVLVCHDGRLVAYCVPVTRTRPTPREIREFARRKLPDYMIPSAIVILDAFPLAPGGKIDRAALPKPREEDAARPTAEHRSSPVEVLLSEIWCDLLRRDRVDVGENFFDAGGDSLLANQVVSRVRDAVGVELPLRSLFEAPTLAGLADVVTSLSMSDGGSEDLLELLADLERTPDDEAVAGRLTEGREQ